MIDMEDGNNAIKITLFIGFDITTLVPWLTGSHPLSNKAKVMV